MGVRTDKLAKIFLRMFQSLDKDGTGSIAHDRVCRIFQMIALSVADGIEGISQEEIEAGISSIVNTLDTDKSGSLEFDEIILVLYGNEAAVQAVEDATEEHFEEGLRLLTIIADQFCAGDFSLKNAPAEFFKLKSIQHVSDKMRQDFDMIAKLKRTEVSVKTDTDGVSRYKTILEKAVDTFDEEAVATLKQQEMLRELQKEKGVNLLGALSDHRFATLKGCIFGGHLATDLDSIAGAIGGAALFDGTAVRCSELNSETKWVLEHWGFDVPPKVEDVITPESKVCLVDFQQTTQLNEAINANQVVGVIDHHALQNATIVCDRPIYIDIRPWGSMATIIAHNYLTMNKPLPKNMAGLLLGAILSDTLNLQSPTTTDMDALVVGILSKISEVGDPNKYAKEQFKAKSAEINEMSDNQLICGDLKKFSCNDIKVGFGVVETTAPECVLERVEKLLAEMPFVKKEKGFDVMFFAIVDIVGMRSDMLLVGPREVALAEATFPDCTHDGKLMNMGDRVSRKKQFAPPLTSMLGSGKVDVKAIAEPEVADNTQLVMDENSNGRLVRTETKPGA